MRHLYVHVPFCPTICPYCDFHVVRRGKGLVESYLDRLEREAAELHEKYPGPLETLYIGGGTPSYLRDAELERLFAILPWRLAARVEVTLEVNPGTVNRARLERIRDLGVNRVSLGVQSFDDRLLRFLGRQHSAAVAFRTVSEALELGFSVSLDLILGLPDQDVHRELKNALALGVSHVSAYTLQIEPGTPFAIAGLEPDPDREAEHFQVARDELGDAGLVRYEVSNYARPGAESRHNLAYWRLREWGGLGPSAAAHLFADAAGIVSRRFSNPPLPRWLAGEPPQVVALSPLEFAKEALMMGLRLREGVDLAALAQKSGLEIREALAPTARELLEEGLLARAGERLVPSDAGMDQLHRVVLKIWGALETPSGA